MSSTTSGPGSDEKYCPFCAEVIKSAAVKCRYCGSDLPEHQPDLESGHGSPVGDLEPAPQLEPEDEEQELDEVVDSAPGFSGGLDARGTDVGPAATRTGVDRVLVALVVLCLALAGGFAALVMTTLPGDLAVAENGQVTASSYRSDAISAGSAAATTILSYGYQDLDADMAAARKVMLPAYAKSDYEKPINDRRTKIVAGKLVQTAKVLSASITSLTKTRASLLLLTNVTVVSGDTKAAAPQSLYRVQMTLQRKDGAWFVSNMTGL